MQREKYFDTHNKDEFIKVCKTARSMSQAARMLNLKNTTFIRYAKKLGCYDSVVRSNSFQGNAYAGRVRIKTEDILNGKYPDFQTYKLKLRLLDEGYKKDACEICGWSEKRPGDKYSPCELHHLDGNRRNHALKNLQILCPNCHALTEGYKGHHKYWDVV